MATVQTSALAHKAGKLTNYLSRTDGASTFHEVELCGIYPTHPPSARVWRSNDYAGEVQLAVRSGAFDLLISLTPDEAELLSQALANAAADARKALQVQAQQQVAA